MTNVEEDLSNEDFLGRPEEETFQLDEDVSNWSSRAAGKRRTYKDGSTIGPRMSLLSILGQCLTSQYRLDA
jgi:hypothetical protein